MIKVLLDQGLPRSAAARLREAGWDAVHAAEVGLERATDEALLERARSEQRFVCTLDADFHAILATSGAGGPSVIRIRRERLRGEQIAALLIAIWPRISDAISSGAMISVTGQRTRIRRLPI